MNVAIVCNGVTATRNQNGSFINSCDRIIRMNQFRIQGDERWIGSRIDIISLMITGEGVTSGILGYVGLLEFVPKAKEIWIPDKYRLEHEKSRQRAKDHYRLKPNIFKFVPDGIYDNLHNRVKIESEKLNDVYDFYFPDSGMTIIETCVQLFKGANIFVTGFDPGRKSEYKYYWEKDIPVDLAKAFNSHPQKAEAIIYEEYKRDKRIIEI